MNTRLRGGRTFSLAERQPTRRFAAGEIVAAPIGFSCGDAACKAMALAAKPHRRAKSRVSIVEISDKRCHH
jgi:hypothetical protein